MFRSEVNFNGFPCSGSREQWTLCRDHVNRNTVHARSSLLTSRLSESGVLTKRDMQNMQSGGGARTGIENRCHNGTLGGRKGEELLNKVIIFVFVAHKKYSHSFGKLWLNYCCHMDFTDVLTMFLGLGTFQLCCGQQMVRKLLDFIKYILICVPKMERKVSD